jgi:hypothetical protein
MRTRPGPFSLALLGVALLALALSSGAAAATVVNGDFESGSLNGWHVQRQTFAGDWFAYSGTTAPIGGKPNSKPVQPPPQGHHAAIADEAARDSLILYQDVSLEAGVDQTLSLLAYYDSREPDPTKPVAPIAIPTPDTLSVDEADLAGQPNQQFRIDLVKPSAPLDSLDPSDILRTVFQTEPVDPAKMSPTRLNVDLAAFAGQTVRLRIAAVATEAVLNAGVDAISISRSMPESVGGQGKGSNSKGPERLSVAKIRSNRRNGTVVLSVRVPGPGLLTASVSRPERPAGAPRSGRSRRLRKTMKATTVKVRAAGTVRLRLVPTRLGRLILRRRHKFQTKVTVAYTPAAGRRETVVLPLGFRMARRLRHLTFMSK